MRQRHRLPGEGRGQKGTGIETAVALDAAGHQDARKRLVRRQLQVGIVLVVAQQDVVFGRALLDQVVFERQRLHHRVGHDDFEADDLVQQGVGLRIRPGRTEVIPDPVAQRARFADVDRVPFRVEVQIDPGLLGQPGNLFLEFVDGHTLLCRVFAGG